MCCSQSWKPAEFSFFAGCQVAELIFQSHFTSVLFRQVNFALQFSSQKFLTDFYTCSYLNLQSRNGYLSSNCSSMKTQVRWKPLFIICWTKCVTVRSYKRMNWFLRLNISAQTSIELGLINPFISVNIFFRFNSKGPFLAPNKKSRLAWRYFCVIEVKSEIGL